MKRYLLITSIVMSMCSQGFAVEWEKARLACFDSYSKKGSGPVMVLNTYASKGEKAQIHIDEVSFPNNGKKYEYLPRVIREIFKGTLITTNRSPYKGNFDFDLQTGVRLILTNDVSVDGLKNSDIDKQGRGHAAVLDIHPNVHREWSGGSLYIRMRCQHDD